MNVNTGIRKAKQTRYSDATTTSHKEQEERPLREMYHEVKKERDALAAALEFSLNGNRPLPADRELLGKLVRDAWIRWAQKQPNPKPNWLTPWEELSESDREVDRQIGEAIARWTLVGDAASRSLTAGVFHFAAHDAEKDRRIAELEAELADLRGGEKRYRVEYEFWGGLGKHHLDLVRVHLGAIGASRWTAFYSDGDGNFRPKILVDGRKPQPCHLTNAKKRWRKVLQEEVYALDFDEIAWALREVQP